MAPSEWAWRVARKHLIAWVATGRWRTNAPRRSDRAGWHPARGSVARTRMAKNRDEFVCVALDCLP
jgi:hypothetical protein